MYIVEPPESGHPRDQGQVSAYGRCPLTGGVRLRESEKKKLL